MKLNNYLPWSFKMPKEKSDSIKAEIETKELMKRK
jgi:hypothetical protein